MPKTLSDPDFNAIIAATKEAGALAYSMWREGEEPDAKVWEKTKGHPVCDADLAVDELLKPKLAAILPDAGWLSEETVDDPARLAADMVWLVDPIDGTRDFVRGRKGWCVSVALVANGKPIFAVMDAPAADQLWTAKVGGGARCNGKSLTASKRSEFRGARIPADELPRADSDLTLVEKPNSIAMRMAMIACDRADFVATLRWGNEWDIAAAHLIAEEAGATVSDAHGMPLTYNKPKPLDFGLICSADGIHQAAVDRLAEIAKDMKAAAP